MTSPQHVAVIGAGLAGTSTAYALASAGVPVTVYEACNAPAMETSFANGGMLSPSMPDPWNGPGVWRHLLASLFNPSSSMLLRASAIPSLATWGLRFLRNSTATRFSATTRANFLLSHFSTQETRHWRDLEGLRFEERDAPALKIFQSREALEGPLAVARALESQGLRYQLLDADACVAAEPALYAVRHRIHAGLLYPDDMQGDAHRFALALADRAQARGARFRFCAPVERIATSSGRVTGVIEGGHEHRHDAIVVANANASRGLIAGLGLRLPVRPAKGYSITFECAERNDRPRLAVIDDAMHAAVVPLGTRLRAVGTAEFAGEDRRLDMRRIDNLMRLLRGLYPDLGQSLSVDQGQAWTGLRPMSADGRPFIGETRLPGLWLNTGHGHLGWTMAAGSATLLSALMLGQPAPVDPPPFAASRV